MPTIKKEIVFDGKGIHSGTPVRLVVRPSDKRGIFFRRVDLSDDLIPATYDNVGETKMRNTTIGNPDGAHVQTIEHLMAALFMAGVDSAIIDINGAETPIMDGSAYTFFDAFMNAGITGGKRRRIIVKRPVIARACEIRRTLGVFTRIKIWVVNVLSGRRANGYVKLSPNDSGNLDICATLVYPEKIIGSQTYSYAFDGKKQSINVFTNDIARARTFGKFSEWEYLKAHGMGRGADETNVIALNNSGDGTLNATIWPDEFVRHKIIDAIGDMYTSGGVVVGKLESYKGSHALNNLVLKKLFSNPENYDIID